LYEFKKVRFLSVLNCRSSPPTELLQSKSTPTCITLSPDSSSFVTFSLPDRQIRIFSFLTGKMTRKYDESLAAIQEMQQAGTAVYKVEDMEFGRRLAVEKELELPGPDGKVPGAWTNAVWDESGAFVLYPTLLGIKGKDTLWLHATYFLSCANSCEHRDKSCRAALGQGRDRPLDEPESVPRRARQEGHHHRRNGRLGQPHPSGQGSA
jgi:hypothetical protein